MAASAHQSPSRTAGDDRNLVTIDENYLAPTLEDKLLIFWDKHGRAVVAVVVLAVVVIVARWAFQVFAERREQAIAAAYAEATDSAGLKAFAEAHPTAVLAGVSHLRLADEAYAAGNFAAAQASYEAATKTLSGQVLGDRARLGFALSQFHSGDVDGAKSALEALANDTTVSRTLRGEAAYHLASLARDAGQNADAAKWADLILTVDPTSFWAQRGMMLRASLPEEAAPAASTETSPAPAADSASATVSFPNSN